MWKENDSIWLTFKIANKKENVLFALCLFLICIGFSTGAQKLWAVAVAHCSKEVQILK